MKKNISLVLLLITGSLAFNPKSILAAGAKRYPNNQELQTIKKALHKEMLTLPTQNTFGRSYFQDQRKVKDKKAINSFRTAWSKVSPEIAPFIGDWSGYEEFLSIYPSKVKNRVCIILDGLDPGGWKTQFSLGSVVNGSIFARGAAGYQVFIKEKNVLGRVQVLDNKVQLTHGMPYAFPTLLENLQTLLSGHNSREKSERIKQFNAASCTKNLPIHTIK
ncbi:MAG TPA: hypothetical protein V6D15_09590 [Oculatellaceae cyanobacterium]|jgi:hypothetical protein